MSVIGCLNSPGKRYRTQCWSNGGGYGWGRGWGMDGSRTKAWVAPGDLESDQGK